MEPAPLTPSSGSRSVLIVDDDRLVRAALLRSLRRIPALLLIDFSNPLEALEHARDAQFHTAMLDLQMPEMDGVTLGCELRSLQPRVVLVFMTANPTSELANAARSLTTKRIVGKPWTTADLRAALDLGSP